MRNRLLVLLLLLAFILTGCSSGEDTFIISGDLSSPVTNLDPQFVTNDEFKLILYNTMEGLLRQNADGSFSPAAAERYEVSDNGLRYTFRLRNNLQWSNGDPVRSSDFLFAFKRIFSSVSPSPYAGDYSAVKNADRVLSGESDISEIGVSAPDELTIEFILERPDVDFLTALSKTAAMPCNQAFFENSKGRYGLSLEHVLTNGAYYIKKWDNEEKISLRRNEKYHDLNSIKLYGIDLYTGRGNIKRQLTSGKSDFAVLPFDQLPSSEKYSLFSYDGRLWAVIINARGELLQNDNLRNAIAFSFNRDSYLSNLAGNLTDAGESVSTGKLLIGDDYRATEGYFRIYYYDPAKAAEKSELALKELGMDGIPLLKIYTTVNGPHALNMAGVKAEWEKVLGIKTAILQLDEKQLISQVKKGDYDIAVVPIDIGQLTIGQFFELFSSTDITKYPVKNKEYDDALEKAEKQLTLEGSRAEYAKVEKILLTDAVMIPLYYEEYYLSVAPNIRGIEYSQYGEQIFLRNAYKK